MPPIEKEEKDMIREAQRQQLIDEMSKLREIENEHREYLAEKQRLWKEANKDMEKNIKMR